MYSLWEGRRHPGRTSCWKRPQPGISFIKIHAEPAAQFQHLAHARLILHCTIRNEVISCEASPENETIKIMKVFTVAASFPHGFIFMLKKINQKEIRKA